MLKYPSGGLGERGGGGGGGGSVVSVSFKL